VKRGREGVQRNNERMKLEGVTGVAGKAIGAEVLLKGEPRGGRRSVMGTGGKSFVRCVRRGGEMEGERRR